MMRKGTIGGRRGFAILAILVALAVASPELAAPAGAAVDRGAARQTMTTAQKQKVQQYINAHPEVLTKHKKQLTTNKKGKIVKRKAKRKVTRKGRAAQRKRAAKKRKAKAKAKARKRKGKRRRVALTAKQRRARNAKNAKKSKKHKKGATSGTTKLIHGIALIFLIGLPFIAVGLLLFGTDYRRRPRAPSNKKRRRVLVITPVGRKY
jgi:Fe2+ transport system protein B